MKMQGSFLVFARFIFFLILIKNGKKHNSSTFKQLDLFQSFRRGPDVTVKEKNS